MKRLDLTVRKYLGHCDRFDGICKACGAIRKGETEPDAREYPCKRCKGNTVFGFEEALAMGLVDVH